jgi:hypothetical protein
VLGGRHRWRSCSASLRFEDCAKRISVALQ